jgi:hypothetical protein
MLCLNLITTELSLLYHKGWEHVVNKRAVVAEIRINFLILSLSFELTRMSISCKT